MHNKNKFFIYAAFALSFCLVCLSACSSSYSVSEDKAKEPTENETMTEQTPALTSMILTHNGVATVYKFGYTNQKLTSVNVADKTYSILWENNLPTSCGDTQISAKQDPINGAVLMKYGDTRYEFVPKKSDDLTSLSYFSILHTDQLGQNLTDKYTIDDANFVTAIDKNISRTQTAEGTPEETITFGFSEDKRTHAETLTVYTPNGNAEYGVTRDESGRIVGINGDNTVATFVWDNDVTSSGFSISLVYSAIDTILSDALIPTGE